MGFSGRHTEAHVEGIRPTSPLESPDEAGRRQMDIVGPMPRLFNGPSVCEFSIP